MKRTEFNEFKKLLEQERQEQEQECEDILLVDALCETYNIRPDKAARLLLKARSNLDDRKSRQDFFKVWFVLIGGVVSLFLFMIFVLGWR